jgi:ferrous-iron efflux pump FieF
MSADPEACGAPAEAAYADGWRLKRRATLASVGVASFLVLLKAAAWHATDSVAMLSALADSAIDVVASTLNMLAVWQAAIPADREHRFGHGKAEALAGLGQSLLILASAVLLAVEAVRRLLHPAPVVNGALGVGVMLGAIVLSGALVAYQRRVARVTRSLAIAADSVHYKTDLLANLAVLTGIVLATWFGLGRADPAIALCVAGYIGYSAWPILRTAYDQLMDRELPEADRRRIRAIVLGHPEIHDIHELRTRMSGNQTFIQFHVELHAGMALARAHAIADQIERQVRAAFPGAEILIHEDPVGEARADGAATPQPGAP